ncbi:MAG: hypothetical protein HY236_18315 [Acidobacteria bacterium]|nr:hypothetical protein [Acidobacteriota bacterium]
MTLNFGRQPRVQTVPELAATNGVVYGVTSALGTIGGTAAILGPGVYVHGAIKPPPKGSTVPQFIPDGNPIDLNNVAFQNPTGQPGTYIFLGGFHANGAGTQVTLDQGTYVLANYQDYHVVDINKGAVVTDKGGGAYGELFVVTKPDYMPDPSSPISPTNPVLLPQNSSYTVQPLGVDGQPLGPQAPNTSFTDLADPNSSNFGEVHMYADKGDGSIILTGLKGRSSCTPDVCGTPGPDLSSINQQLYLYQPFLMWSDRRNNGVANSSLGTARNAVKPCAGEKCAAIETEAQAFQNLNGVIYQPAGGHIEMAGSGETVTVPAQIITGGLYVRNQRVTFAPPTGSAPYMQNSFVSLVR